MGDGSLSDEQTITITVQEEPSPTPTMKPEATPTTKPEPTPTQGQSQTPGSGGVPIPAQTKKPAPSITPSPTKVPVQDQQPSDDPAENLITTDYPELVKALEFLKSADIRDNLLNPTYGTMMKRELVITLTADYQKNLKELAKRWKHANLKHLY